MSVCPSFLRGNVIFSAPNKDRGLISSSFATYLWMLSSLLLFNKSNFCSDMIILSILCTYICQCSLIQLLSWAYYICVFFPPLTQNVKYFNCNFPRLFSLKWSLPNILILILSESIYKGIILCFACRALIFPPPLIAKLPYKTNFRPSVRMSTTFRGKRDFLGP